MNTLYIMLRIYRSIELGEHVFIGCRRGFLLRRENLGPPSCRTEHQQISRTKVSSKTNKMCLIVDFGINLPHHHLVASSEIFSKL